MPSYDVAELEPSNLTLDSILEGILEDDNSSSSTNITAESPSNSTVTSPMFENSSLGNQLVNGIPSADIILDIKSEIPDSCTTMNIMVG